jgi:hypothetical protein
MHVIWQTTYCKLLEDFFLAIDVLSFRLPLYTAVTWHKVDYIVPNYSVHKKHYQATTKLLDEWEAAWTSWKRVHLPDPLKCSKKWCKNLCNVPS